MCDMCPDDERDIATWRERIEGYERYIANAKGEIIRYTAELKAARKELKRRLRAGEIRA